MPRLGSFRARHQPPALEAANALVQAANPHAARDAVYVPVELLEPELRKKPVVISRQPDQRGVVSAASYEGRKHDIQSAMPLRTAGRVPRALTDG